MKRPLRALLLAAGLGTRLRPITLTTPKCLVEIAGEPLLERWLKKLEDSGCEAVLINTHYLAGEVEKFVGKRKESSMRIEISYEPELLGTAGTLMAHSDFFDGSTGLLIHADNAMAEELDGFLRRHESKPEHCWLSMVTFDTDVPKNCGIVKTDDDGIVIEFYEKVEDPPGNTANGALYAFDSVLLNKLAAMTPQPSDFSTEVIPKMMGRIQTWHTKEPYMDIGTPIALSSAHSLFSRNK